MAELRPYNPTIRDRIASALMGEARPGSARANMVEGMMGSRGIGNTGMSLADITPVGAGLGAQEAMRDGDYRGAAMNAMFLGPMARTANRVALTQAEKMAARGANRDEIWKETGWFQGPDSKWRFEIDDSASKLGPKALEELTQNGASGATQRTAAGVIHHNPLYDAYPELRAMDIDARYNARLGLPNGEISNPAGNGGRPQIKIETNSLEGPSGVKSIGLHEMQHRVQDIEGFAPGANPNFGWPAPMVDDRARAIYERPKVPSKNPEIDALAAELSGFDTFPTGNSTTWGSLPMRQKVELYEPARHSLYWDAAGEVEARNVQKRMNMTPEQRAATPPWATQDVPFADQIIRAFGGK